MVPARLAKNAPWVDGEYICIGDQGLTRVGISQDQGRVVMCQQTTTLQKGGSSFAASLGSQDRGGDQVTAMSQGLLSEVRLVNEIIQLAPCLWRVIWDTPIRSICWGQIQLCMDG
jgi:hypothetical protein